MIVLRLFLAWVALIALTGCGQTTLSSPPAPRSAPDVASSQHPGASVPTLALIVPSSLQPPGTPIDVEVRVSGVVDLGAFEFDLQYDRSRVEVMSMAPREFLGQSAGCNATVTRCAVILGPHEKPGAVAVGAYSYGIGDGASGDGVLAVLRLRSTGKGGAAPLHLANAKITDTHATPMTPATLDAMLLTEARIYLPLVRR